MKLIAQCMFTPRLYKIYKDGPRDKMYEPFGLEKWGDKAIWTAFMCYNIGIYTSPLLAVLMYMKGSFSISEVNSLLRLSGWLCSLLAVSFFARGVGRAFNDKYVTFLKDLHNANSSPKQYLDSLRNYDFDFSAWPVSYQVPLKSVRSKYLDNPFNKSANHQIPQYQQVILQLLSYGAIHTFALKLIYPGSVSIMNFLLWHPIFQGRAQLVESHEGQRSKIGTSDGNYLDTLFVDNRGKTARGDVLVVCCEGNTGFYEIGICTTPVNAGFSTLGWNHPGFGESTGQPYPAQEKNAIDAVMLFAINELQFQPNNIIMFGWSIGGYTATWAAVHYPVKGLVLDATFDDLLPLARQHMPKSWGPLVKEVIRSHVDLNVAELMNSYNGPVQLIRRTEDEIICLRPGVLSTNCGNALLLKLLQARNPKLFESDPEATAENVLHFINMPQGERDKLLRTLVGSENHNIVSLISRYSRDYRSSHCTPLPSDLFAQVASTFAITLRVT